ncbi:MAG: nucleotidyltransferase domain-containing protein [Balneola sp.]|nr:MAG: nucleotidyltransferase domain-containing protein [Balneola sp.]
MEKEIKKELQKLEHEMEIKILYAVESGSRAWGFPSKNSDWDVRFIYIHNQEWYLSIDDKKDSYVRILPNEIDLSGWELRKTLKLFRKSNPPFMEWLDSPIVYKEDFSTISKLRKASKEYFNPKSCMYHYLSMAEGNFREYLKGEKVRIKKYFYVLRPVLACSWIERTNKMAPMEFETMVESEIREDNLKAEILNLLTRKKSGEELDWEPKIETIDNFLEERITYFKAFLKDFDFKKYPDTEKLNRIFRETLEETA